MVLPPPCHGNNVAHLHITGKEATCPHTISLGLRLGTLSKKKEHNSAKPKVLVGTLSTLCQLSLHAHKHGHAPVKNMCLLTLNGTVHVCPGGLV
jgi:hypothetical protein